MARDDMQLKLRVTEDMKNWLSELAKSNGRSVNAEIIARLESSSAGGGADAEEWKRRYQEEHQAYLRMDHMFTQQMRLAEDYARHVSSRNREVYNQAGVIESLANIILSLDKAPSEDIRDIASNHLKAAAAVKYHFPTDYEAIMARKELATPKPPKPVVDDKDIPF